MSDAGKTRIIGLPYGEKNYDDKPFSSDTGTLRTDRIAISISRVSVLTRGKNAIAYTHTHTNLFAVK